MNNVKSFFTPIRILAAIVFILILTGAIVFQLPILNALPLLISTIVMFLQARVNRYAFLLGGINALLYTVAYAQMTLYSSAAYALLVSFPLQLITFFNWQRHTSNNSTEIRTISAFGRILLFAGMGGLWLLLFLIFSAFGSAYLIFDNTVSVLGIVATLLCAGRFAEFTMIQWISSLVSIATYTIMTIDDPSRCVWLIHVLYSCTCSIITYITIRKKEKNQ